MSTDVDDLKRSVHEEVLALRSKISTNPDAPAASLDLDALESLVSDAPDAPASATQQISSDDPSLIMGGNGLVAPVAPTVESPFEPAEHPDDKVEEEDGKPAEPSQAAAVANPEAEATPTTEDAPAAPAAEVVGDMPSE